MKFNVGKSSVRIEAEGCVRCGALWSHAWTHDRTLSIAIDGRQPVTIDLHVCGHCAGVPVPAAKIVGPKDKGKRAKATA